MRQLSWDSADPLVLEHVPVGVRRIDLDKRAVPVTLQAGRGLILQMDSAGQFVAVREGE